MFSGTRINAAGALAGALLLWASVLPAQTDAENKAASRALAFEGVELAKAGDCKTAIDRFTRAIQLYTAPTIVVELGECQCKVGLLVEGTENLNQVARENLGANPPEAFVQSQEKARRLLGEYLPKLGKLTVVVQSPSDAPYKVKVNGADLPPALVGVARPSNPGEHQISVEGEAYEPASATVTVAEAEQQTVTIELVPHAAEPSSSAAPPVAKPAATPVAPVADSQEEPSLLPAYIAFGVGAVALGAGTVFGLSASSTKADLEKVCVDGDCPPSAQSDIDSMNTSATLATVGFGVGLVAVGVGVYFLVTASGEQAESATKARQPSQGFSWTPHVGLGSLGLSGRF